MVTETGLKLRTRLESAKTLRSTAGEGPGHQAGDMIVVGDTIGVVVEDADPGAEFVLVYEAEKIVVPKASGQAFAAGDEVYFDEATGSVTAVSEGNVKCGRALAEAGSAEAEALIDLMVME